jgi:hypothetical protein
MTNYSDNNHPIIPYLIILKYLNNLIQPVNQKLWLIANDY